MLGDQPGTVVLVPVLIGLAYSKFYKPIAVNTAMTKRLKWNLHLGKE